VDPINDNQRGEEEKGRGEEIKHGLSKVKGQKSDLRLSTFDFLDNFYRTPPLRLLTSIRFGKASLSSSRWVMMRIFAKSCLTC